MKQGRKHLLGIRNLNKAELYSYLDNAVNFLEISERDLKKVPALRGKTVINLFLEPSTRTRASFEIAGKRLSADTINLSGSASSVKKGESLLDTARTLQSMSPDVLVMRHSESGACEFISHYLHKTSVVNAGDGMHEHPTQALLDTLTLREHFLKHKDGKSIEGIRLAIVGDIRHSRVARSTIFTHMLLGNEVRLVGPATLIPREFTNKSYFGEKLSIFHDLETGLEGADVVMCLRLQRERQGEFFIPDLDEYTKHYCVTERLLAERAPDSVVLHPGPVNRGIEVSSQVLDGPRSLMNEQVNKGVAVRMAVLFSLARSQEETENLQEKEVEVQ